MKALLTLFGGRSFLPATLLVTQEKPDIVVAISSIQSYGDLPKLRYAIDKFQKELEFKTALITPDAIDAFAVFEIQKLCESIVKDNPSAEWIFDITGGTALMSIGAYEAARVLRGTFNIPISCWYLNTAQTRVIKLVGKDRAEDLFHINVDRYATAYNRELIAGELEGIENSDHKEWLQFAQILGTNLHQPLVLKQVLKKIRDNEKPSKPKEDKPGDGSSYLTLSGLSDEHYSLLQTAQGVGLISELSRPSSQTICFRISYIPYKFLNGAWLEVYVWDVARKLRDGTPKKPFFDDCRWNQLVQGNIDNELDVVMTYKAQLIVAECKTGEVEALSRTTLYKWDSVSSYYGGRFVGKLFITSILPPPDGANREQLKSYQGFLQRAASKEIVVVTGEQLPDIAATLYKEATNPTYPRI